MKDNIKNSKNNQSKKDDIAKQKKEELKKKKEELRKKKERKKKIIEELDKEYKGYSDYVHSNESLGVYIVRDIVKSVNTKGYWIDIVRHTNVSSNFYAGNYSPNLYILFRLYPRITKPVYPPKPQTNDEYQLELWQAEVDAITWQVSHRDIDNWKRTGNTGYKKTLVCYYEKYSFEEENSFKKKNTEIRIKKVESLSDEQFDEKAKLY